MEKLYSTFSLGYRLFIVIAVIFIHYHLSKQEHVTMGESTWIFYAILGVYSIAFSIFKQTKWIAYIELISVLVLLYIYQYNLLYFLVLMPFISMISSKAKTYDIFFFTFLIAIYFRIANVDWETDGLLSFGILTTLGLFHSRFHEIENLQTKLYKISKEKEKLSLDLGNRQREIEITSNMFVHSKNLSETIEVEELKQQMVHSSREFFNAEYACLYVKTEDEFFLEKESGKGERFNAPKQISMEESEKILIENKLLRVTIDYETEAWGIISVYGKRAKVGDGNQMIFFPFQEEDYEVLSVYLKMAMSPMKHAKLLKLTNYLANNDSLTGISNRRYFEEQFEYIRKRANRGEEFAMLLFDIDHFKHFNDEFGHDMGDQVLKQVAETVKYTIREVDIIGRLGGEEFAVILPGVGNNAEYVAERIRKRVQGIPCEKQITVSIGVAYFNRDGRSWEELYKHADEALYYAKEHGRNQVITYGQF